MSNHRHHWTSLLVLACLSFFSTPALTTAADQLLSQPQRRHQHQLRHHHQNQHNHRSLESEFTGEWNGQWYANGGSSNYGCNGGNCNDDDGTGSSSSTKTQNTGMWIDNVNPDSLTPEQIITYVSLGLLAFMTLLFCCVCYPELVLMGLKKLFCGCCGLGGGRDTKVSADENLAEGADYVRQDEKKVKKKKSPSKSKSKSSKDVELV